MQFCLSRLFVPVERYLWRTERYIRGKQAWFLQLKLCFNSFCLLKNNGRQVSRNILAKSLVACDSRGLHEENHLRFINSKHFRFYWRKKHFISEWYFTKNHEIGSLAVRKVKNIVRLTAESWAWTSFAWESKSNCWSFRRHVYRLDESKSFYAPCSFR